MVEDLSPRVHEGDWLRGMTVAARQAVQGSTARPLGTARDRDFFAGNRLGLADRVRPEPSRRSRPSVGGRVRTVTLDNTPRDDLSRILGDELRRARRRLGWTRKQLQSRLRSEISLQTLGTYESGTRRCSVARLFELCEALDVLTHDLLARVYERIQHLDCAGRFALDLERVVRDQGSDLLPLRRWAHERLEHVGRDQPSAVFLGMSALEYMAQLCGVTTNELIWRLRELGGRESTAVSAEPS